MLCYVKLINGCNESVFIDEDLLRELRDNRTMGRNNNTQNKKRIDVSLMIFSSE